MKKLGIFLMTVFVLALSIASVSCSSGSKEKEAISLSETAITLEVGESKTLTATTNVKTGVKWTTSNGSIATVDGGKVTAVSAGTATITATAGNVKATCTVTVNSAKEYVDLTVDKTEIALKVGGSNITVTPSFTVNDEALDCTFVWTTENDEVATVENGIVTPVGVGTTTVTVSVEYKGQTYSADVTVEVKPDEQIRVSKGTINLALAEINGDIISDTFTATAYNGDVENKDVTLEYSSSDEKIATVSVENGIATVTSVSEGTCTISVYYTSSFGKIESTVEVIVTRSTLTLDEVFEIQYEENNTVFDLSSLSLQGELDGVYFADEKVDNENGVLNADFVESNKGIIIPIEVRTTIAVYNAELLIAIPYVAEPKQENTNYELVDMPTFTGDPTTLGFPAGTETAYELLIDAGAGLDGWTNRAIINASASKEFIAFDVIVQEIANAGFNFNIWVAKNITETQGSYMLTSAGASTGDADANRKVFILGADDRKPSSFTTETIYTVYVQLFKGDTHVHFSTFTNGVIHLANFRCLDQEDLVYDPTLPPPPISQGENRGEMPIFNGDETTLGFEEGTTVYEINGAQSNSNDVKLVAQVDPSGDNAYAKLDFVVSEQTSSIGLWITAINSHLGYYAVTPTGFTADDIGDSSREIFVRDASGNEVSSFEANTVYTLYIRFDGREATVQVTTWENINLYVANVASITEEELPFEPTLPPAVEGKEISILFIGNSFSDDTEAYIVDILLNLGYTDINVGNLYIGGCSIDTHYDNIIKNFNGYDFRMRSHNGRKYTEYETVTVGGEKQSIAFAIAYKDWDVISVQQASGDSGKADTYENLDALVDEVKKQATNKDVEIVFNMTWAYQADSTHEQFPDYNSDQMTMYNAIVDAVQTKVKYTVVPNGTAIQNARTSLLGDTLTRDGYHLNLKYGRLIAGLTFVAKVTDEDISTCDYVPSGITSKQYEIIIESVQNAIANPFAVTNSQIEEDVIVEEDVMADSSNPDAVSVYEGDVTALGFAEGTKVYEYVGENSNTDKAAIKVDSANYDYVDVQFVIGSGEGFFFMHGIKGGVWHNGGVSYVIDPGWIRLGDGNNTESDRVIQVFDAEGNKVTTLMKTNTLYTLRVFIKVGELDEIRISKTGSTIYFANVTQGLESDIPEDSNKIYIYQGIDNSTKLPNYDGDVTQIGFDEGEYVQEMYTIANDNPWGADSNGKTRENLSARIPMDTAKTWVTVRFALSVDFSSGDMFFVWGTNKDGSAAAFTYVTVTGANESGFVAKIIDGNGNTVSEIKANTVYTLVMSKPDTNVFKLASMIKVESSAYFATSSITYYDEDPFPNPGTAPSPDQEPQAPIVSGETTSTGLSVFEGDKTSLGFDENTTVYELVSAHSWNDRVKIKANPNCKYLDVQFTVTSGAWYFNVWLCNANGMLDGSYLVAELGGGAEHATFGEGFAKHTPNTGANGGKTRIQVLNEEGFPVIGGRTNGTIYTLRVWLDEEDVTEVQIGQDNVTMYFGNIESTDSETQRPIKQGDDRTTLAYYEGDETALGFTKGTKVQQLVGKVESGWGETIYSERAVIIADGAQDYIAVDFILASDYTGNSLFQIWPSSETGSFDMDGTSGVTTATVTVVDNDGYRVKKIEKGKIYTLRVYDPKATHVAIGVYGLNTIYFANVTYGTGTPVAPILPNFEESDAVSVYEGDVTSLGFEAGSKVYTYVGATESTGRITINVDSTNYEYADIQFVIGSGDGYFLAFALNGGSYLNGGASYVIDPSNIRLVSGSAMDRTIRVLDANGEAVTTLMSTKTLYTLRIYTNGIDQIQIEKGGSTIYFANVTQGHIADLPKEGPIKQGDGQTVLKTYEGDETAHGFTEGTFLQYMVTETVDNAWGSEPNSGKTREQLAARISGEAGKYVTIKFATSEDIPSGSVFYVWGLLGSTHTKNGGLNFTDTTYGRILDVNGYAVSSISKNTVYVLELYIEGTDTYKLSNLVKTGMEIYFAPDSITCSDESMAVEYPSADSLITAGGSNKNAVIVYKGDETELGFAEGSKVYEYKGETTNDKISITTDCENYDYVDVQLVFDATSEKTWFLGFAMSGSAYLNGADAYILAGDGIRFNANKDNPLDRKIEFFDKDGNLVSTSLKTGELYTLRVYVKANNVTSIVMRQVGVKAYFANVTYGNAPIEEGPTGVEIKVGDAKADPTIFDGEETGYGFAEGTEVVVVALESATDVDDKRLAMEVDSSKQYLAIDFALEFGLLGNIYVWTVTDGGERVLGATIMAEGGVTTENSVNIVIKDSNGNDVTSEALVGLDSGEAEKYTLYVYYNGANEVHIGCDDYDEEFGGNILYFANAFCNND